MNLKSKRPVIGLDSDGVLSDFYGSVLDALRELGLQPVNYGQLTYYDLSLSLGEKHADIIRETLRDPSFWVGLSELPGVHAAYHRLAAIADVFIVTSPYTLCTSWEFARRSWLKRFSVADHQVIVTQTKHVVQADVFIDDHPGHVQAWSAKNPTGLALLVDQPWNQELTQYGQAASAWQFNRVDSFSTAVMMVEHQMQSQKE